MLGRGDSQAHEQVQRGRDREGGPLLESYLPWQERGLGGCWVEVGES